jgi:outer membrane receptor protein involved in Fe transport
MYRRASPVVLGVTTALIYLSPAASVLAQSGDSESGGLAEVVVTATRREERLQDVPISVSAFSQDKIDSQGLRNIDDLTRLSPGITFQRNGNGSSANYNDENSDISIRGIDSQAGTSTTGIYIDDTPIQSRHIGFGAVNAFPALFDLDRVEVLRGPQGTLFGAGAEGGVVRFITPQPGLTQDSGYVRAELAGTQHGSGSLETGAAFGGPIIQDVLGFRVSASFRRDGGWVDRASYTLQPSADPTTPLLETSVFAGVTQQNANWHETMTVRGALKWAVNDAVTLTTSLYYQNLTINDTASYWVGLSNPAADIYYDGNALRNPSHDPFWLAAVKLDWNLGFAQLVSNTSYFHRSQHSTSDYTQYLRATYAFFGLLPSIFPQPGDAGYATFEDDQKNWYQEIRLNSTDSSSRFQWSAGVFFSHLDENIPESIYDTTLRQEMLDYTTAGGAPFDLCDPLACPGGRIFHGPVDRVVDKQIALFGELTYKITNTLKATVGLRASKVDFTGTTFAGGPFLGTPDAGTQASSSEKPLTPKVVFSWQPDRDDLYYVSASKGYRVGGVNVGVGTICEGDLATLGLPVGPDGLHQVPTKFASDNLWSYEIGGKNSLLDRRLQINSSLFWVDWRSIQQNVYLPSCGEQFTANLGHVVSRGGDIDILYKPVSSLFLQLTAAYTDAKFTKASCAGVLQFDAATQQCTGAAGTAPPIVSEGNRLVGAPWSFTATAEETLDGWSDYKPYLRTDFQYTTAQTKLLPGQDAANALTDVTLPGLPATRNLQVRAGLRFKGFDVSVFGDNLLNDHPVLFKSRDIADDTTDQLYFGRGVRPRSYGLTMTYRY